QREIPPFAIALDPIQRRTPVLLIDGLPAEGQPKFGTRITVVSHALEILAIRNQPIREGEWQYQCAMPRQFVVVTKIISVVPDRDRRFIKLNKLGGSRPPAAVKRARRCEPNRPLRSTFPKNREEWVLR